MFKNTSPRPESRCGESGGPPSSPQSATPSLAPKCESPKNQPGMALHVRATEKVIAVNEDEELRRRGFNLGATLGEGSYAKVKVAFWNHIQKRVAIKIINRKKAPKDFQTKFLPRELEIMKKLKHQYIIELFQVMTFNGKVYMILEMAGHGDLLEYIKLRGAIPDDKARQMYSQLATAIAYLHQQMIVHRDLKCENVLLDAKNQIKVSDFGFSRRQATNEYSSTFCGSAAYAAPEILQGIPYTGKAYDIWSMGVILYIMVCGSMPYDDSNIKKMIRYQTERKVGFSKSRRISSEVKSLIHHMLDANASTRFTVAQVLDSPWLRPETAEACAGCEAEAETGASGAEDEAAPSPGAVVHVCQHKTNIVKDRLTDKPPPCPDSRGHTSDDGGQSHHSNGTKAILPTVFNKHITKAVKGKTCSSKNRQCPCPNCQRDRMTTQPGWSASPPRGHQVASSRMTDQRPVTPHHRGSPQQEPRDRVWRTDLEK